MYVISWETLILIALRGEPTKDHGNNPIPKKKINTQLKNNAIINNVVDKNLLNEKQNLNYVREVPQFLTLIIIRTIYIRFRI